MQNKNNETYRYNGTAYIINRGRRCLMIKAKTNTDRATAEQLFKEVSFDKLYKAGRKYQNIKNTSFLKF